MKPALPLLFSLCLILLAVPRAHAQLDIALPGTPKGELPMELMQSYAYCKGIGIQLESIEKRYPDLSLEIMVAKSSWFSSPFAAAAKAIEADMLNQPTDGKARALLDELDRRTRRELADRDLIGTRAAALDFLKLTALRAKGEIEIDMVRGNLLWNHKPYQETPEREAAAGFVREVRHPVLAGPAVRFQVPMSWKEIPSENPSIIAFRNCYGHGNVWITVTCLPTTDALGTPISGQQKFDFYTREALAQEYARMDITLTSFMKTKVNRLPALMFTRWQPYEQLGMKARRAAEVIRAFGRDHSVSFQINTVGPEGEATAEDRIKRNQALFKIIGGSLQLTER